MFDALFWPMMLLIIGLGLVLLEALVPSGGVLTILAIMAMIGSIVVGFLNGTGTGIVMMCTTMVIVPALIAALIRWWPQTPIGRMMVLHLPESEEEVLPDTPEHRRLKDLVGQRGAAKTKMLPSGAVIVDGEVFDAVTDGVAVEPGQPIRVVAVRANRVVVTLDDQSMTPLADQGDDVLSQPAESLGLGSLEEPA
jgi:membrane-bound serine protease (ClpP class)